RSICGDAVDFYPAPSAGRVDRRALCARRAGGGFRHRLPHVEVRKDRDVTSPARRSCPGCRPQLGPRASGVHDRLAAAVPCGTAKQSEKAAISPASTERGAVFADRYSGTNAMPTRCAMLRSLAAVGGILIVLNGEPAQALNTKSWVSNAGSDSNSCTLSS